MHRGPGRETGLTLLESLVATGMVTAGAVFAWQYYHAEISSYLALVTTALERFVTS